jgi:hypothetical protein
VVTRRSGTTHYEKCSSVAGRLEGGLLRQASLYDGTRRLDDATDACKLCLAAR